MNSRIERLRRRSQESTPQISAQRAVLVTRSYRRTEGSPAPLRRALALKHLLENITVVIGDDELIVGEKTETFRGSPLYPELYCMSIEELDDIQRRDKAPFAVDAATRQVLQAEVIPYWQGNTMVDRIMAAMDERWKTAFANDVFTEYMISRAPGHVNLDGKVITRGLFGLKADIQKSLLDMDAVTTADNDRRRQLEAMALTIDAAVAFALRHAEKALELARREPDARRRAELETIAAVCRRVPAHPARSFREALQSYWFVHLVALLEVNNWAIGPGRFDQYMHPLYQNDIQNGRLSRDDARELLECLWVKFNNAVAPAKENQTANMSATYNDFALLNIGGLDVHGRNGVNDLSYLLLDVVREMHLIQPNPCVLLSDRTPPEFTARALSVVREGSGQPAIFNHDLIIRELVNKGKSLEDARLGGPNGCVTANACGKENMASTGYCNWVKILEIALNDGVNPFSGQRVGLKTGDTAAWDRFEDVIDAWRQQLAYFVDLKLAGNDRIEKLYARHMPVPFLSVLVDDCIRTAKDFHAGGARYNMSYTQGVGLATLTDCMAAIKQVVFEEGRLSLPELLAVVKKDFKGHERLRQLLLNRTPKYGNNDDAADGLMRTLVDIFYAIVNARPNARGGRYGVNLLPTTVHVYFGSVSGATPDGRHAGAPFSDGISPAHGADRKGPTAVVQSAAKLDQARFCGTLLNQKFSPQVLKTGRDLEKLASLVSTYFKADGHHIQFNVLDAATLRKAQTRPGDYRNLMVRVAGYSDHFVNLSRALQNEIIARTPQKSF